MATTDGNPLTSSQTSPRSTEGKRYINQFLDAACHDSRRAILELLIPPGGRNVSEKFEMRSGEIAKKIGLAKSTTSEHLKQLQNLHLVSARREGNSTYYRLRNYHLVLAFHEMLKAVEVHYRNSDLRAEHPET
jgi:DNA-binding transcriptional ArsR family regulator